MHFGLAYPILASLERTMIKHVRDTTVRSLHYHNALRISWCDSNNCERFLGLGGRQQVNHEITICSVMEN